MWLDLIKCIESEADIKYKLSFLNTLINVHGINLQEDNERNQVKAKIREFCSNATQRTEGLLLLYAVVHCNSNVYVDNWSQIVLGSLKIPDSLISREIPLKVLNKMLTNFGCDRNYNDVFTKVIPEILPILLDPEDDKIYKLSCQTLAVCMRYVPEIAGTRLTDIENLLMKELDNPYGEIIEAIGECFAALPTCLLFLQKKAEAKLMYKDIWCNIFTKVINTMHGVLNSLMRFTADQEGYFPLDNIKVYKIPSLERDNDIPLSLIDTFKSLCQCLAKMMSSENCYVCLPISELFDVVWRVFKIQKIIERQGQDPRTAYLKLGFLQMLNGIFVVLEALFSNFYILDQGGSFQKFILHSLNAVEESSFQKSSVSQVRGSTWKLISVYLKQYGNQGSFQLTKEKSILIEILADIDIEEKQSKTTEDINQKANKIFACTYALKVLKNLLETSDQVEKDDVDEICSTLLRVSKFVIRHTLTRKPCPFPYSDDKCRKMLFDDLLCCAVYGDPLHSKCILEAQNIFTTASTKDTSRKVRRICHKFRKLSRYYLNPRKPPPDAVQYSIPSMLNRVRQPVMEGAKSDWGDGIDWAGSVNGPSSDDQMDDSEVQGENAYSDKMENEGDSMTVEENEGRMNHDYRRIAKQSSQSVGEEDSVDDSDVEPTYVSTDSNPQRIDTNDSRMNSFGMQSCAERYPNESRTERRVSEEVVPNLTNSVENNIEGHVSAFVEVKSDAQKPPQVPVGNGEWRKKDAATESDEEDSDVEEEGEDEECEANEEGSDNAPDEASDGKRSPEFDEEMPRKRQKCMDEEADEEVDEEVEDEDIPVNNQSSDEEEIENGVNNLPVGEQNAGSNSENLINEESQDDIEDTGCRSPTIREMCSDFVLAEPAAPEIS